MGGRTGKAMPWWRQFFPNLPVTFSGKAVGPNPIALRPLSKGGEGLPPETFGSYTARATLSPSQILRGISSQLPRSVIELVIRI